ncbi:MAG: UPF0158 family protein [Planctomycetota bacterium]|jgi:hypothetical protein
MSKIKILEYDLFDLLEDHSEFRTGYLDQQTGEIVVQFEEGDEEIERETEDMIEKAPDRYLYIESIDSHDGFRIMERFVVGLPPGEDRRLLEKALSWKKPFSNFRDALYDMDDLRQKWYDFHEQKLRRLAMDWLEAEGIDAELVSGEVSQPTDSTDGQ